MIYLGLDENRRVIKVSKELFDDCLCECRGDWESFEQVVELANQASDITGDVYLGIDSGEWVSPRWDIICAPCVGDEVSYGFNGDYYPCGKITAISPSFKKITTDSGKVFFRRKKTGSWIMKGGTWSLVPGHISRLNPEF